MSDVTDGAIRGSLLPSYPTAAARDGTSLVRPMNVLASMEHAVTPREKQVR